MIQFTPTPVMAKLAMALSITALSACVGTRTPITPTPPVVHLSATERFVQAVEAQNCVLNTENVGVILANATLSNADLLQIVPQLEAEGRAEVSGSGSIRVLTDNCI